MGGIRGLFGLGEEMPKVQRERHSGRFAPLVNAGFFPFGFAQGQNDEHKTNNNSESRNRSPSGMTNKKDNSRDNC